MFSFIRGVGQFVLMIAGILSVIYALRPDIRRWVETEFIARDAHYYVGMVEIRPGGVERWQRVQFYSNRWELDDRIFDERLREDHEDAFDVFRALPGETLIASPDESYGPLPGRLEAEPLARIETLALVNQCFKVESVSCRSPLREDGVLLWRTDPGCDRSEAAVDAAPDRVHKVAVWVEAVRFTCTE